MQTSENGIAFIKRNEGFASVPYNDNGHMAWGYGHDQEAGEPIPPSVTQEQATAILQNDLETRYEPFVNKFIPDSCTQNQFDALVDFCYNLGEGALQTMLGHGWEQVPLQIPRWNHAAGVVNAGLTARRQAEVVLFNT